MIFLYYLLNLLFTYILLLSALSAVFFHIPLAKKLINKKLINNEKEFINIQWKRFYLVSGIYILFIIISVYIMGIGPLISTAINCFICIITGYKKIIGKDPLLVESFLNANIKYFKDSVEVKNIVSNLHIGI